MPSRRLLALVGVLVLVALSGCIGQFGVGISESELSENAEYDWDADETVAVTLTEGGWLGGAEYEVVYSGDETEFSLSEQGFVRSHAVDVRAVQFRYPNGTVVGHEQIDVDQSARETTVELPAEDGQFAFTGDRRGQELTLPAFADGDYAVALPEGHTVGDLLLSDVSPRSYDTERVDGRERVIWSDVSSGSSLLVRHYEERDWYVFYGLLGVLAVAAVGVYAYYSREISRIRRERATLGLDVDVGDDDDDGPPPGMG